MEAYDMLNCLSKIHFAILFLIQATVSCADCAVENRINEVEKEVRAIFKPKAYVEIEQKEYTVTDRKKSYFDTFFEKSIGKFQYLFLLVFEEEGYIEIIGDEDVGENLVGAMENFQNYTNHNGGFNIRVIATEKAKKIARDYGKDSSDTKVYIKISDSFYADIVDSKLYYSGTEEYSVVRFRYIANSLDKEYSTIIAIFSDYLKLQSDVPSCFKTNLLDDTSKVASLFVLDTFECKWSLAINADYSYSGTGDFCSDEVNNYVRNLR